MTYKNRIQARLTRFNHLKVDGIDYNIKTKEPVEDLPRY